MLAASIIVPKVLEDYRHSQQIGRLVTITVQGEFGQVRAASAPTLRADQLLLERHRGWPDGSIALRRWLVLSILGSKKADVAQVSAGLARLADHRSISPFLGASIRRWSSDLRRWSESDRRIASLISSNNFNPVQLFEEGRGRVHEAAGYERIGRGYDASVLYLWSIERLRNFIESAPDHPDVPEALFLLGTSYIRLRHTLPAAARGDRFLNLCSELYPDSIWATRSAEVWERELGGGA